MRQALESSWWILLAWTMFQPCVSDNIDKQIAKPWNKKQESHAKVPAENPWARRRLEEMLPTSWGANEKPCGFFHHFSAGLIWVTMEKQGVLEENWWKDDGKIWNYFCGIFGLRKVWNLLRSCVFVELSRDVAFLVSQDFRAGGFRTDVFTIGWSEVWLVSFLCKSFCTQNHGHGSMHQMLLHPWRLLQQNWFVFLESDLSWSELILSAHIKIYFRKVLCLENASQEKRKKTTSTTRLFVLWQVRSWKRL